MQHKTYLALAISSAVMLSGCSKEPENPKTTHTAVSETTSKESTSQQTQNPFFKEWNTPFGSPPFSEIKTADFLPAFEKSMADHKKEIDAITQSEYAPTFDKKLNNMLTHTFDNTNFPTKHLLKDINLVLDEADRLDLSTEALAGVKTIVERALTTQLTDLDYSSIFEAVVQNDK